MVDNQHKKISGYRDLSLEEIELINRVKRTEQMVALLHADVKLGDAGDPRELAIARSHFEDAFIHLVKAVAKPETPWT
jgi:hypothetical protein